MLDAIKKTLESWNSLANIEVKS